MEKIDENIQRYMPTTAGSIIITSRNRRAEFPESKLILLKPFQEDLGGQLLRQLLKYPDMQLSTELDNRAPTTLANAVRGLPLGIRYLADLINKHKGPAGLFVVPLPPSQEIMTRPGQDVDFEKLIHLSGDEHILDRVWTSSFGSLELPQRTLLGIISFLDPDEIPRSLFGHEAAKDTTVEELRRVCGTFK